MPVNVDGIDLTEHRSSASSEANWRAGLPAFAGSAVDSTAMYYEVPPGNRLGWHFNSAEEVQFVVRGSGELLLADETQPIAAGDLFLIGKEEEHDIRNSGSEELCVVAFFPATEVEHHWRREVWPPDGSRVTRTVPG